MTASTPWEKVALKDLGESLIGLTYRPSDVKRMGTLVLRSSNIQDGRLSFADSVYVDAPIPDRIRVRENDILICVRNGSRRLIGKSVMLDRRVIGETFGAFMAVYRSAANPFLRYFFQSHDFKGQIDMHLGATINQITNGSLNSFTVALPSDDEQRSIVENLEDIDEQILLLDRLIEKKSNIKQGVVQRLFIRKNRLPGFARDWRETSLHELGTFLKGRGIRRDDVRTSGIPCIRYGEIYTAFADYTSVTRSFVSPAVAESALPIRQGDILFAASGETKSEIGMSVAYVGAQVAVAGGDIIVLRGTEFNAVFLSTLLNSPAVAAKKARQGQGDAVVHISSGALSQIRLDLPERAEQDAIASVIEDLDRELEALAARREKTLLVKQGMLRELLTGRVRLPSESVT